MSSARHHWLRQAVACDGSGSSRPTPCYAPRRTADGSIAESFSGSILLFIATHSGLKELGHLFRAPPGSHACVSLGMYSAMELHVAGTGEGQARRPTREA